MNQWFTPDREVIWPPRQLRKPTAAQSSVLTWERFLALHRLSKDPDEHRCTRLPTNLVLECLPNELLCIIFEYCSNVELIRLSLLCRRLHHLALPVVLQSFGVTYPYEDLTIGCGGQNALPALRIALFCTSTRKLTFRFKSSNFFYDLQHVIRLLTKMTRVEEVVFEFPGVLVYPWDTAAYRESTRSKLDDWIYYMDQLFAALRGKGCVLFRASLGDIVFKRHSFTPMHSQSPLMELLGRQKPLPFDDHEFPALSTLRELHIESSLFSPSPFLRWTLSSISGSSSTITSLSLGPFNLLPAGWEHLLEAITLPNLSHLALNGCSPEFAILAKFLERHNIMVLRLRQLEPQALSKRRGRTAASAFAPLKELHAPVEYIIPIMNCGVPFPHLTTVVIVSPESWQPSEAVQSFLRSLHMLCDAHIPPDNRMHVSFRAESAFLHAFAGTSDDAPAGMDWTYPQIHSLRIDLPLNHPATGVLHHHAFVTRGLANALERFTGIRSVTIGYWPYGDEAVDNLTQSIGRQCPWIESGTILDQGENVVGALK